MAFREGVGLNQDAPEGRHCSWMGAQRIGPGWAEMEGAICPVVLWSGEGPVGA